MGISRPLPFESLRVVRVTEQEEKSVEGFESLPVLAHSDRCAASFQREEIVRQDEQDFF